jgi:putative membrane protein
MTLIAASLLQSCGGNTNNNKQDSVDSAKDVNAATVNDAKVAVDEKSTDFAVKAANGGMMEVALGKMAQEKSKNPRVKNFGAMMERDHSKADGELMVIAESESITLPATMGADMQKHVDELSKKSGKEFDIAYIDMMVSGHKDVEDAFNKAATDLSNPQLKTFASNTLPVVREHLDSAKAIKESLKK